MARGLVLGARPRHAPTLGIASMSYLLALLAIQMLVSRIEPRPD